MITIWNPRIFKFYWISGGDGHMPSYDFAEVSTRWFGNLLFDWAQRHNVLFPWSSIVIPESIT